MVDTIQNGNYTPREVSSLDIRLSRAIRARRLANNLSQVALGLKIGVGRLTIWRWENNVRLPDLAMLEKLAHALGCRLMDLFSDEPMGAL